MNDHDSRSIENDLRSFVERIRLKINEFLLSIQSKTHIF